MRYDPLERHRQVEQIVIRKKVGGDQKKYSRFRRDRWYGGVITADCAGCGLDCVFCWVHSRRDLEGQGRGEFLTPKETTEKLMGWVEKEKMHRVRISGGEPTIGRDHLLQVLNLLTNRRVHFILETNGILIGADRTYAQDLAHFPFLHVRVSLKGCSEAEFEKLTGADRKGFQMQLEALRNLSDAGVSVHPAIMLSFSERQATDQLYHLIWKIDPRMHSEIEREEVFLYPHVAERLKKANLQANFGKMPKSLGRSPRRDKLAPDERLVNRLER